MSCTLYTFEIGAHVSNLSTRDTRVKMSRIHFRPFCAGRLSQTKTRQRRELVERPYVFDRSYRDHDQELGGLRRVPRHRHSEGK